MGQLGCNGHTKAGFDYLKPDGFRLYLLPPPPPSCPGSAAAHSAVGCLLLLLSSPFAAFFFRPAQIACFGLDVQETQNTAQQKKKAEKLHK